MASCRSRKTGNCSDYSQNKLLKEKAPETFLESFPISRIACLIRRPWEALPVTLNRRQPPGPDEGGIGEP